MLIINGENEMLKYQELSEEKIEEILNILNEKFNSFGLEFEFARKLRLFDINQEFEGPSYVFRSKQNHKIQNHLMLSVSKINEKYEMAEFYSEFERIIKDKIDNSLGE
jgi:hydroxymethylpyrimidine pyrophosphatase-like HAD family hydrolase